MEGSMSEPAPRRLRRARVAAALLVLLAGGLVAALAWDDVQIHREATRQAHRIDDLGRQVADTRAQLGSELAALHAENGRLQDAARNPTLTMWNACAGPCTIGPDTVRVG